MDEKKDEIIQVMDDLRMANVDFLTQKTHLDEHSDLKENALERVVSIDR